MRTIPSIPPASTGLFCVWSKAVCSHFDRAFVSVIPDSIPLTLGDVFIVRNRSTRLVKQIRGVKHSDTHRGGRDVRIGQHHALVQDILRTAFPTENFPRNGNL